MTFARITFLNVFIGLTIGLGCATKLPSFQATDKAFTLYIGRFNAAWGKKSSTPIIFDDLKDDVVGECWKWPGYREIRVDRKWWAEHELMDSMREELIFHELGHCELGRKHVEAVIAFNDGVRGPASIMYPYTFGQLGQYVAHREYYLQELFQPTGEYVEVEKTSNCGVKDIFPSHKGFEQ